MVASNTSVLSMVTSNDPVLCTQSVLLARGTAQKWVISMSRPSVSGASLPVVGAQKPWFCIVGGHRQSQAMVLCYRWSGCRKQWLLIWAGCLLLLSLPSRHAIIFPEFLPTEIFSQSTRARGCTLEPIEATICRLRSVGGDLSHIGHEILHTLDKIKAAITLVYLCFPSRGCHFQFCWCTNRSGA